MFVFAGGRRLAVRVSIMTKYQPATPHSDSIIRPFCPKCKTKMDLFGIEAESFGYETQSFSCPKCNHVYTRIGKSEDE